jgi:hypothetical protein
MSFFADLHAAAHSLASIARSLASIASDVAHLRAVADAADAGRTALEHDLHRVTLHLCGPEAVGIEVSPGTPSPRTKERAVPNVKLVKKSAAPQGRMKAAKAGAAVDFQIVDNEDDTFTVGGVDAAGAPVDISSVATLDATSGDPSVMSVDPPAGMVVTAHALKPGSVTLTFTATWNDGSIGPFTIDQPVSVTGGPATGLIVTPGTPTVR